MSYPLANQTAHKAHARWPNERAPFIQEPHKSKVQHEKGVPLFRSLTFTLSDTVSQKVRATRKNWNFNDT